MKKFYTARYDRAFKGVFLTGDNRLLTELLSRILKRKIEIIDYSRNELDNKTIIEKGKKEKRIEIAKKMLSKRLNIEDIIECTGLSKEEISKLS